MARRSDLLAPVALAGLTAAAAGSLVRVFDAGAFLPAVLGAAVLPHLIGAVTRRVGRSAVVAVLASLVAAAGYAVVLFAGHASFGVTTIQHLADLARTGWQEARVDQVPIPVTDGPVLLAVGATWLAGMLGDLLAFRHHATLGAMTPGVVLFVWVSTLGAPRHGGATVALFAGAAVVFLLVQNLAVIDERRTWLAVRRRARTRWTGPAALIGGIALLAGLLAAPLVPGAGADPLLDFQRGGRDQHGTSSYRTSVAPLVDVGAKLRETGNRELFTVRASAPDYWRITALDEYTGAGGGQWTLSAVGNGLVAEGLGGDAPSGALHQEFRISGLGERWLPAAYRPVVTDLAGVLVVVASSTLVAGEQDSVAGLHYTVDSVRPPTAATVTAADQAATQRPVPAALRPYVALPADFPTAVVTLAEGIVERAGAVTPYAKAAALRNFFRDPTFVYDPTVDPTDDVGSLQAFLRDRRGFCVQFASAYALMARGLGLPTRVAVGFTPGAARDGVYHVTAHDAHAWPEVWLAGLGWTHLFDPTPPARGSQAGGSALPGEALPQPVPPAVTTGTAPGAGSATTVPPTTVAAGPGAASPRVAAPRPEPGLPTWLVVVLALTTLVALAGGYVGVVSALRRRRRQRRRDRADPQQAVQGAWDQALERLGEARVAADPALTPLELAGTVMVGSAPMRTLARTYSSVRYGDAIVDPADADRAWDAVAEVELALDAALSSRRRWQRRLASPITRR